MNSLNALNEATLLNNEGSRLLTSGKALEALHFMQSAVHVLKGFPPSDQTKSSVAAVGMPLCPIAKDASSPQKLQDQEPFEVDGLLYMFDRPLLFPTNLTVSSKDEFDTITETLSTYVIFNFALACHQYGKQTGNDAPLQRAMELYDLFIRTLNRVRSECDLYPSSVGHAWNNESLQCLALNNLANLHYDYCDYDESQYCMDCMHDILNRTDCLAHSPYLSATETEELLLNQMYLQTPTAARAA